MGSSLYSRISRPNWEGKPKHYNTKIVKKIHNFGKIETKRLSFGVLGTCSFIILTFLSFSKFCNPSSPLSEDNSTVVLIERAPNGPVLRSQIEESGTENETRENDSRSVEEIAVSNVSDISQLEHAISSEKLETEPISENNFIKDQENLRSKEESNTTEETNFSVQNSSKLENVNRGETETVHKTESSDGNDFINEPEIQFVKELHKPSESDDSSENFAQLEEKNKVVIPNSKLTCDDNSIDEGFPYARPAYCEMTGEIRINPSSSLITLLSSPQHGYQEKRIRPYARKDDYLIPKVKEVVLKPVHTNSEAPYCTVTHKIPTIIFSLSVYTGNFFHDMADVLIPLFLTTYHFKGEVQFFVTNYEEWWVQKYRPILKRLSRYGVINFDMEKNIHCFQHAFLGLVRDRDLIIHRHATRNPRRYSMLDFTRFLRRVYALRRGAPIVLGELPNKKPKMLIISRKRTRKILNLNELVAVSAELGFDVVVSEAGGNVKRFAQLVNSCDVMLAIHGAGLTNQIFLPPKAVLIQVVPWGKMDWMATNFYGRPAREMRLKYLEYYIKEEESSLIKRYPRDHIVFKNPMEIHKQGWQALADVVMSQDVRLDLWRFKPTLLNALDLLQE